MSIKTSKKKTKKSLNLSFISSIHICSNYM